MNEHGVLYRIKAVDGVSKVLQRSAELGKRTESRFNGINNSVKSSNASLLSFNEKINKGSRNLDQLGRSSVAIDKVKTKLSGLNNSSINIPMIVGGGGLKNIGSEIASNIGSFGIIGRIASKMGPAGIAAGGLALGLNQVEKSLGPVLSQFEKYEAVLSNSLGSDRAAKLVMKDIVNFASKTPQQVDELTESWVKLAGTGFKPSMREMMKMADLVNSQGKGMVQWSEAMLDAAVGEFERLKEFNIHAKKDGDKVTFTFKNQSKTVDFTRSAINKYLLSLGDLNGVQGASTKIMKTHGGATSNLEDKITQLKLTMATGLKPVLSAVVESKSKLIDKLQVAAKWFDINKDKIALYASKGLNVMVSTVESIGGAFSKLFQLLDQNSTKISSMFEPIVKYANWVQNFRKGVAGLIYGRNEDEELQYLKLEKKRLESNIAMYAGKVHAKKMSPGGKFTKADGTYFDEKQMSNDRAELEKIDAKLLAIDKFGKLKGGRTTASWIKWSESKESDSIYSQMDSAKNDPSTDKKSNLGSRLDDLVKGGKETKNFYISIDSLIKEQNINTTKMEESASKIKDYITELLMTSVRNFEVLEGSK